MDKTTIQNILYGINQPVCDALVTMVKSGEVEESIRLLIKLEGHWITDEMAKEFINHIKEKTMSHWSHNPEMYDEIIFKRMVAEGLATEEDDSCEVVSEFMKKPDSWKLSIEAERDFWSDMADMADYRREMMEDR